MLLPDGAGATQNSQPLARPALLPTQRLTRLQPRTVQLRAAAQLDKVRVAVAAQLRPWSGRSSAPVSVHSGSDRQRPELKVGREEESGEGAIASLAMVLHSEQSSHVRHQDVTS